MVKLDSIQMIISRLVTTFLAFAHVLPDVLKNCHEKGTYFAQIQWRYP